MTKGKTFQIPTRPYDIIAAINRSAAATGGVRYAMQAANANYNGHHYHLYWNDYRAYYVLDYHWGERVVLSRGEFRSAFETLMREYNRGDLGFSATISLRPDDIEAEAFCSSNPLLKVWDDTSKPFITEYANWPSPAWKYAQVGSALRYERQLGCPATAFLLKAETEDEYRALIDAHFAPRRSAG